MRNAAPLARFDICRAALLAALVITAARPAAAQIPDRFENLEVLPDDIPRDSLIQVMRGFSFALGVRCEHCHVAADETTSPNRFSLRDRPPKEIARHMMRMTARVNDELLAGIPGIDEPTVRVQCKTCHRGVFRPYCSRRSCGGSWPPRGSRPPWPGTASCGRRAEWPARTISASGRLYELARELRAEGATDAAIAMLELNEEFHPTSRSIPLALRQLYEDAGRRDDAVTAYRRALDRNPESRVARERLNALGAGG